MRLLLIVALLISASATFSQVNITFGDSLPENPSLNHWYSKSYYSTPMVWNGEEWKELDKKFQGRPFDYKGLVWLKQGDMKAYFFPDGKPFLVQTHWLTHTDSLFVGFVCGKGTVALNHSGDTIAFSPNSSHNLQEQYMTYEDRIYYCMPAYVPGLKYGYDVTMRNWGLLNTKAEWVIPPKFDHPFKIEDGKAELFHKGERQVWNLAGERLE
jgi:hypothetical protein